MPSVDGRSKPGRTRVLILGADAMVVALVGLLLDPDRFDPVFPLPEERAEDALSRVRPPLVLLLDSDLDAARSDLFFARVGRTRAAVVMFGGLGSRDDVGELARLRGVSHMRLPTSRAALTEVINAAIASAVGSGLWSTAAVIVGAFALVRRIEIV